MTIAVTGTHGVLGRHLVGFLAQQPRVRRLVCIDRTRSAECSPKVTFVSTDLTALGVEHHVAEALADHHVDCVIHLAFRDGPSPHAGHSHELESIGSFRLVQACLKAQVRKLLMGSRTWVYGATPNAPALIDEHQPAQARRSERFFADKMDAERDVLSFRAPGRGRYATVLRLAPVVDPAIRNHVVRWLGDSRTPNVLGFDPMWQLLHVSDACRFIEASVFRDTPSLLNLASAGAVPLSVCRRMLGAHPLHLPRSMAGAVVSGLWLSGFGNIPPSMLDYLQFSCVADVTQAQAALRLTPEYSTLSILQSIAATGQSTNFERSSC
jgi:UDP-glucose 4-epimerase